MAKTTGPLLSLTASGSIAGALIFQRGLGGQITKRHHRGNQTPTAARLAQQTRYRDAVADWRALDEAGRAPYVAESKIAGLTAYQTYMRTALLAPVIPSGVPWDGGASVWDGGATTWPT